MKESMQLEVMFIREESIQMKNKAIMSTSTKFQAAIKVTASVTFVSKGQIVFAEQEGSSSVSRRGKELFGSMKT